MTEAIILQTERGPITLRAERAEDAAFLYTLFRSHTLPDLAALSVDAAMKETLIQMQFRSQTSSYRAQYPDAQFLVLERDGMPFGRLIVQEDAGIAIFVDFALLPEMRGAGMGTAVIRRVLDWVGERCAIVRLSILASNEASLRMTRRLGFVQVGETPPHVDMEWRR